MDHPAVAVPEHLELDVLRLEDAFLEVDVRIIERRLGLTLGRLELPEKALLIGGDPHPLPSPTGRGLDHDRKADLGSDLLSLTGIRYYAV
jgi:hypothetical protein